MNKRSIVLTVLVAAAVAAIPFFRNTLASNLLYSALLFGTMALLQWRWPSLADASQSAASNAHAAQTTQVVVLRLIAL